MNRLVIVLLGCVALGLHCPAIAAPIGIYWTDSGKVQYAGLDGSSPTTLVGELLNPTGLYVTDDYLYWTDRDDQRIRQANTDGTNVQIVLNASPGVPRDLNVTNSYIYYVNTGVDSVSRANSDGTCLTSITLTGLATIMMAG